MARCMNPKVVLLLVVVVLCSTLACAQGHTTLLATSDPVDGGVVADLYLDVRPGEGRVFIESSPLTRLDTQISTRFAKEVACNYVERDCDNLDFFYTIRAHASIIGGPSAGAAMAALTVAELQEVELNESVALTGTINSGALVGNVGGIQDKIDAASRAGITKVLIPKGERTSFAFNRSLDLVEYGQERGVEVVEVFSLDEVMVEFTGQSFREQTAPIQINSQYTQVMRELAMGLCERTDELRESLSAAEDRSAADAAQAAQNLTREGQSAFESEEYYAAASYCFGSNVRYKYIELLQANMSNQEIDAGLEELQTQVQQFENNVEYDHTISDVQILAVVLDRLSEAETHIVNSRQELLEGDREASLFQFAFAAERIESADSWSSFFGVMGDVPLDDKTIEQACVSKVAQAEERVQYTSILLQREDNSARERLNEAELLQSRGEYVRCLHKASLAKAEANVLLTLTGVRASDVPDIIDRKREAAQVAIARQTEEGMFPIIGYSYYEYAGSLRETDRFSALLFAEYALEFSSVDEYDIGEEPAPEEKEANYDSWLFFVVGIAAGLAIAIVSVRMYPSPKKKIIVRKR